MNKTIQDISNLLFKRYEIENEFVTNPKLSTQQTWELEHKLFSLEEELIELTGTKEYAAFYTNYLENHQAIAPNTVINEQATNEEKALYHSLMFFGFYLLREGIGVLIDPSLYAALGIQMIEFELNNKKYFLQNSPDGFVSQLIKQE